MFKFLNLQPEIFGIDINDLSLRIAKLKKRRGGFRLVSFNEVQIDSGVVKEGVIQDQKALVKIIKSSCKSVKGRHLDTKHVAISLPEEKSFSQVIQMPKMAHEELVTAVPFEAENYIPLPIEKVYMDFQVINQHSGAAKVSHVDLFINVMPKPIIDSYVSCFKEAGLVPYILEVESQAIVRALVKSQQEISPSIVMDFGQTKTSFIIFSGKSIRFTCSIPISSQQLTLAIAENLGISFNKAEELKIKQGLLSKKGNNRANIISIMDPILSNLAEQIKKYINFYHGHVSSEYAPKDGKIEKIILCGGGANLKGFGDFLYKKLAIPVELGDPFANVVVEKRGLAKSIPYGKSLSFTTAIGLALRGASEEM